VSVEEILPQGGEQPGGALQLEEQICRDAAAGDKTSSWNMRTARLKRIVADLSLDKEMLRRFSNESSNYKACSQTPDCR
jgi:hypothetical protein